MTRGVRRFAVTLALASGIALPGVRGLAHHSIAGMYDGGRQVEVDGVITRFRFVSPHPFIDLEETRTGQAWQIELDNRHEFDAIGVTAQTLKPGDRVVVGGSPARQEPRRMYGRRLSRPSDGFGFEEVGSRPRLTGAAR
jgi:hypothetical protein